MAYIDTKQFGKCETCFHHSEKGCNTYCDSGESYRAYLSKFETVDVVEVIRCKNCEYWRIIGNGKAGSCQNKRAGGGIRKAEDFCSFAKEKEK